MIHLSSGRGRGSSVATALEKSVVDDNDGELDVSEVLDGDDHVVEHGEVLAVHAEEALEGGERPDGGVGAGGHEGTIGVAWRQEYENRSSRKN